MSNLRTADAAQPMTLEQRRAFMKLPIEERRRLMLEQAEKMVEHYKSTEDYGVDAAIDEAERRWQAYKEGKIKGIPAEDVVPELRARER